MKQQINFRASDLTARQLSELAMRWGTSQTETVTVCIDRIHREEMDEMNLDTTAGFDARNLSREAVAACKALHFTPRRFEALNADRPGTWDGDAEYPVLRIWNARREITLTNRDLTEAATYLS